MSTTLNYEYGVELSTLYTQRAAFDPLRQPEVATEFNELRSASSTVTFPLKVKS